MQNKMLNVFDSIDEYFHGVMNSLFLFSSIKTISRMANFLLSAVADILPDFREKSSTQRKNKSFVYERENQYEIEYKINTASPYTSFFLSLDISSLLL